MAVVIVVCLVLGAFGGALALPQNFYSIAESSQCGVADSLQDGSQLAQMIGNIPLGPPGCNPPKNRTCADILQCLPSAPSGNYQLRLENGSTVQAYCDMEGTNCGGVGGWMRVGYLDSSVTGATCPSGFAKQTFSGVAVCGGFLPGTGCKSTSYPSAIGYKKVCGKLEGYAYGSPDGFPGGGIDDPYVDGVSLTHSNPRQHIWTYGSGLLENAFTHNRCPCSVGGEPDRVPAFVGSNYYCECGLPFGAQWTHNLYVGDPLWDGENCDPLEVNCCSAGNQPWFLRSFPLPINSPIELRICTDVGYPDEAIGLNRIELYVM